jgi:hypothetical protein
LKAKFTIISSDEGVWTTPAAKCGSRGVVPGDTLQAHVTEPSEMTRKITVKNVTVAFDRATDVVSGTAPTTGSLDVSIQRGDVIGDGRTPVCSSPVSVNQAKHYSADTTNCDSGYDAAGGDYAFATWQSPGGDFIENFVRAPFIQATIDQAKVTGVAKAFQSVSVKARSVGTLIAAGQKTTGRTGAFAFKLKDSGTSVPLEPQDVLKGNWAGQTRYAVRQLITIVNQADNEVRGHCDANTRFGLLVRWSGNDAYLDGVTNGSGSTDVLDTDDHGHSLTAGDKITFVCARNNGDRTGQMTVVA